MEEKRPDILNDIPQLRRQAYDVPEGYFEAFKSQMKPYREDRQSRAGRLAPYISLAASFLLLVTAGTLLLQRSTPSDEFTQEDFILYSNNLSGINYYEETTQIADAGIEDEDIIEYLIYSRISAEEIELSK